MIEQLLFSANPWFYIGVIGFIVSIVMFACTVLCYRNTEDRRVNDMFLLLSIPGIIGFLVMTLTNFPVV